MKYLLLLVLFSLSCAKNPDLITTDEFQKNYAKKAAADPNKLTVTFDEADVIAHRGELVHQHLLLSKKVSTPVTVTVSLVGSSASSPQDFTGFESGNTQSQAIVIEPGTLVGHFPKIAVTKQALCGGKFQLQLSATSDQSLVLGEPETIQINCPQ